MLYWVTVTPYSHSFFTYLFISCPFFSVFLGALVVSMCLLGSGLHWEHSHTWKPTFPCQYFSGSGYQQFRLCGTMVHFQCLSGCLCCLCVGLCHLVLIGLCPLCLWRHRRLQTPFLLHMVLRPVILINYIWKHHVVNMGYAAHHCILGDQMLSWLRRTCLQLMTFFSSETCLLHFCTKMLIAKPEEACSHHKFDLVSSPPGYGEVLVALMSWIVTSR